MNLQIHSWSQLPSLTLRGAQNRTGEVEKATLTTAAPICFLQAILRFGISRTIFQFNYESLSSGSSFRASPTLIISLFGKWKERTKEGERRLTRSIRKPSGRGKTQWTIL